jgi:hypothetical protein
MPFKVRDLMITMLPTAEAVRDIGDIQGAVIDIIADDCGGSHSTTRCPAASKKIELDIFEYLTDPEQVEAFKQQLRAQLLEAEEQMKPQTLDEVQLLEERLTGALEELRHRRAELAGQGQA